MPDSQGNTLPPLPDNVFDGEKYSTEVKQEACKHNLILDGEKLSCKKCRVGWSGRGVERLYQSWKDNENKK